jgi:hypothetical protein
VVGRTALALLALLVAVSAQASSLERFERYLRTTHSARADFEQQVFDARQALIQTATGHFAFERPGRFRWVYVTPMRQLIVGDGARVWIYDEDLAQVTVRRLASALGSTPAALISGSTDVMQAFAMLLHKVCVNGLTIYQFHQLYLYGPEVKEASLAPVSGFLPHVGSIRIIDVLNLERTETKRTLKVFDGLVDALHNDAYLTQLVGFHDLVFRFDHVAPPSCGLIASGCETRPMPGRRSGVWRGIACR